MRKLFLLLIVSFPFLLRAQSNNSFPQQQINAALGQASRIGVPSNPTGSNTPNLFSSGVNQLLSKFKSGQIALPRYSKNMTRGGDTLWIGLTPKDTLRVTGTWQTSGPIVVVNDGVLVFEDAYATVLGDIYVLDDGQLAAINSTLYIPQQYFYQRAILAVQHSLVEMENCTLNFGGLTHNFVVADSATMLLNKVHFTDWTTTGTYGKPVFAADSVNTMGEIIISDSGNISIKNTDTVLLWHQVPKYAQLNWTFPNGLNLANYSFTPASPGVNGIKYSVEVDTCQHVWWALMPEDKTNITINNSDIRAIGAWFTGNDSTTVSGLVDNSSYISSSFFTDRTLQLNNSSVTTWSLYPMDSTTVNIKSCIAGEIGSENNARTTCTSIFLDGSGGYFWATNTSLQLGLSSAYTSNIRSEGNGLVLIGYCSIASGVASGIDNSILFLVQTSVLQTPVAYDGSDVWVAQVSPPASGYVNDSVVIPGSAYILRGPSSQLMHFHDYSVWYQPAGGSAWYIIADTIKTPVTQNTLVKWNTAGLAAGNYNIMLVVKDEYGDSINANYTINLLPALFTGVRVIDNEMVSVFPNPASGLVSIDMPRNEFNFLTITDLSGKVLEQRDISGTGGEEIISTSSYPNGIYFIRLTGIDATIVRKIVVQK